MPARRLVPLLALLAVVAVVAAARPAASQPGRPPLSTRLQYAEDRVMLVLRSIEVRCREHVPATCDLPTGADLAILRYDVRNHGRSPYDQFVDLFSLLEPPRRPADDPVFQQQIQRDPGVCGPIAEPAYDAESGVDPPVAAGDRRRFHALFPVSRGVSPARVIYHDDDFPTCSSVPRVRYPDAACRPRGRARPVRIRCDFFER